MTQHDTVTLSSRGGLTVRLPQVAWDAHVQRDGDRARELLLTRAGGLLKSHGRYDQFVWEEAPGEAWEISAPEGWGRDPRPPRPVSWHTAPDGTPCCCTRDARLYGVGCR